MNNNIIPYPYINKSVINRRRRQKQVRKNILFIVLFVMMVFSLSIIFLSFSAHAKDKENQPSFKYFKSIEVSSGDTLWSIANEHIDNAHYKNTKEYIAEVKKMNSLTSNQIIAGRHIIIPYYSTEPVYENLVKE